MGSRYTSRQRHWKAAALAKQVEHALALALMDSPDERLQNLSVWSVEQTADPGTLRVTLGASQGTDCDAAQAAVSRASGMLRTEVARAIHRKKTPILMLVVVPEEVLAEIEE